MVTDKMKIRTKKNISLDLRSEAFEMVEQTSSDKKKKSDKFKLEFKLNEDIVVLEWSDRRAYHQKHQKLVMSVGEYETFVRCIVSVDDKYRSQFYGEGK